MKKIMLASVCAVALIGNAAQADDGQWYTGIDGSYSILGKEKTKNSILDIDNHNSDGVAIGGIIGYDFGKMRLEGEIGKHFHNVDRFKIRNDGGLGLGGIGNFDAMSGKYRLTNYMLNMVYDLGNFSEKGSVEPFVGVGVGVADMNLKNLATSTASIVSNSTDMVFAYQMFAGLRVPLSDVFEMSFKYRYLGTADANLYDRLGKAFKASYDTHDFVIGLTYRFGGNKNKAVAEMPQPIKVAVVEPAPVEEFVETVKAPEPMPEPAAGPVINKGPFVVYFDFDSSHISANAEKIIQDAAFESQKEQQIQVNLSGHADRSGSDEYNKDLALARAVMVKNALISNGVDASIISIENYGEKLGEVETADGVKEPKNRRVVIILK